MTQSNNSYEGSKMKITNIGHNDNQSIASLNAVPACQRRDADTDWFPAVDVTETQQEYVFDLDLPGLMPEEVQLEVDSAAISVSGKRLHRSQSGRCLRLERPAGAFIRHLPLPSNTTGEIYGSFADGVLELRVPKTQVRSNGRRTQAMALEPEESRHDLAPAWLSDGRV